MNIGKECCMRQDEVIPAYRALTARWSMHRGGTKVCKQMSTISATRLDALEPSSPISQVKSLYLVMLHALVKYLVHG